MYKCGKQYIIFMEQESRHVRPTLLSLYLQAIWVEIHYYSESRTMCSGFAPVQLKPNKYIRIFLVGPATKKFQ